MSPEKETPCVPGSRCLYTAAVLELHHTPSGLGCPNKGSCGSVSTTFHNVNTSDVSIQILVLLFSYCHYNVTNLFSVIAETLQGESTKQALGNTFVYQVQFIL